MNGILALWKERGMTSHDCVFKLRKILRTKKVGHTGTLDPDVDGVLPICIGSATKLVELMMDSTKTYSGEITIGFSTTTEDKSGDMVEAKKVITPPTDSEIDALMATFVGEIKQVPPMYSAVKVNGKRLYEYARANQIVERPERYVTIFSFSRVGDVKYNHQNQTASWRFNVTCSKGTYVRTLAVDLGEKLGYPAHMSDLTRTQSGGFTKEDCLTLEQVASTLDANEILVSTDSVLLQKFNHYNLSSKQMTSVKNGAVLPVLEGYEYPIALCYNNKVIALYDRHPHKQEFIKPYKMFLENYSD